MTIENKLRLKQLRIITLSWMAIGVLMTLHDYLLLNTDYSAGLAPSYSFLIALARNTGAGFIGGLLGGSLMVFYINVHYTDKPYLYTIAAVIISFLLIVAFITTIMGVVIIGIQTGNPFANAEANARFHTFLRDPSHAKAAIAWSFVVAITQLLLQVSQKFGTGMFWQLMVGRYNTPREEKKIFMFLDINSSTALAEKLGDQKYHALLRDFFADISTPILNNKGHVYQYVGDEVVVAWNYNDGTENMQCIRCFYEMKDRIEQKRQTYLHKYGVVPSFKAGIHCGRVVGGEVGILKRDITYSGDVLNTASRILGKCGEFNEELIATTDLLAELRSVRDFISRPLGAIKLRGKAKEVMLNALIPACGRC